MKQDNPFQVNPTAENVSSAVAAIVLALFIIAAVVFVVLGIEAMTRYYEEEVLMYFGGAVVSAIVGLITWASIKMFVNISRSLYNINDALRNQQRIAEEPSQETIESN